MDKRTIFWRISHGLKWENKLPKLKRSIDPGVRFITVYIINNLIIPLEHRAELLSTALTFSRDLES